MVVLGIRDLAVEELAASFETKTETGQQLLRRQLENPSTDYATIEAMQTKLKAIKRICRSEGASIQSACQALHDAEADVMSIRDAATDTRHAEYYKQIMWDSGSRFAWINKIDWVGELVLFFRTIFLPGLAVVLPLVVFIAPFFVYHFILKQPLSFGQYLEIVQTALKKTVPSVLGKPRFAGRGGIAEAGEQFIHIGVSLAMFGASMWNQVSAALNMRRVAADMRRRADSLRRFSAATSLLSSHLGIAVSVPDWPDGDLALFGAAWNEPARVAALLEEAGRLDMLIAVATKKRTCFVAAGSHIDIQDIYHPGLAPEKRVYNSIRMDGSGAHVLLTGPNRGGKSTLLKSLGAAVLMAQTFGIAFARKATMPVFHHIISALSPSDTLGKMSLFEAEIEFAKEVRARIAERKADEPVFLMMDEIFHGTNAHDGVEASQVFLDDLYRATPNVFSVVSTHYMDLPARYGGRCTQNLCMDAAVDSADPDRLIYSYRLVSGVNRYSSVREILRERGLLQSRGSSDEKRSESGSKV
jgi:energy-coupling factor transporter ATP-binding protein EcfA2